MVAMWVCGSCRGVEIPGLFKAEPEHCHGSADMPAPPGVLGGWRCSCECRNERALGGEADAPKGLPSSEPPNTSIYKQGAEE